MATKAANRKVDEEQVKTIKSNLIPASASAPGRTTGNRNDDEAGKRLEVFCKWALNIAAFAAAIVFGIWAPLSYNITLKGNSGNDAASSSMLSAVLAASSQASAAASQQSAILEDMGSRIGAVGQLWLVEFCAAQTTISACQQFIREIDVVSLVTYLASTTAHQSSTSIGAMPTVTPTPVPKAGGVFAQLPVPAILGIVFAVLVVIGWLIGVYLFLSRRREIREEVAT